jgi:excisionase family DNA binding protein
LFGVHVRTVSRWADRGELPRIRVGGIARFRAEDVERLIAPDHDASPAGQPSSSHDKADARGPYSGD